MKKNPDYKDVKKLGLFYRVLAFSIALFSAFCVIGILVFGRGDGIFNLIGLILFPIVLLYVAVPVVLTGYPPKLLLWTSDKEDK